MSNLTQAHYVEIKCPRCESWLKFLVGVEHDGDENGVYTNLAAELEGQSCTCNLSDEEVEEAGVIAKDEYEAPETPCYPV
jgi:hypothetical protein